ncbi:MAG: hypothetical protein Ct9H300mP25_03480 [Acidobacteriota bacterium]|nr:MAG: hypothetical protein Ct9H300mP25_03480 [Acidobacteriota bacterium]
MDNPLVQVEPGVFIWTIPCFCGPANTAQEVCLGSVASALEERQEGIRKSLDDAEQARKDSSRSSETRRQF